ncbi:Pentatricopeptide repeat-containing protein [Drosera capensis]
MLFSSSLSCTQSSKQDLPTSVPTCIAYLQSCARSSDHKKGKELHSWMLKSDFLSSRLSITSLINMYSKCRTMRYASSVFEMSTSLHNVYIYNAIIAGCVGNDLCEEGFDLFVRMRYQGVMPYKFTFPCVIKGCLEEFKVKKVHGLLLKLGLESDVFIGSALVSSYLKYGELDIVHDVFNELDERDDVLWNTMINGCVQMGKFDLVLDMFRQMSEDGVSPSNFTFTGVLSALSMNEDLNNGKAIHGLELKKGYDSTVAISNALLDLYGKCNPSNF